jgi:glycosyltransferase involved in cell wall biosynthesis
MVRSLDLTVFLPALAGGGAERVVLALLRDFHDRGICCEIALAAPGGELADAVPPGVRAVQLGQGKALRSARALRTYLAERRPRALLTSVLSANLAGLLAVCGLRNRPRCVVRESSTPTYDTVGASPRRLASRLAVRWLYPRADAVIALSDEVAADLRGFGIPQRLIRVIPNPVLELPAAATTPNSGRPPSRPYVLACGRLEPQKDYATLLRAFARLTQRPLELVILGEGSLRRALAELACELGVADRVHFPGFVAEPGEWYQRAAVFAHTARWEGFPNAVSDALSCRLPVVATDSPGAVAFLLDRGRLGALVPPGDDAAVAAAIDAVLRGEIVFPDPQPYLQRFGRASVVQRYLDVLFPAGAS